MINEHIVMKRYHYAVVNAGHIAVTADVNSCK